MLPLVGGPDHGDCLLPLLEQLASMEETVVRDNVCGLYRSHDNGQAALLDRWGRAGL